MALKDKLNKFPTFMRGFGAKKMIVVLLNFDWNKDYIIYTDTRNHTKYDIIPAYFPPQDLKGMQKGVKGGFKLSNTMVDTLKDAIIGFDDEPKNHTIIGWYNEKTKNYTIKRLEGDFKDTKKTINKGD